MIKPDRRQRTVSESSGCDYLISSILESFRLSHKSLKCDSSCFILRNVGTLGFVGSKQRAHCKDSLAKHAPLAMVQRHLGQLRDVHIVRYDVVGVLGECLHVHRLAHLLHESGQGEEEGLHRERRRVDCIVHTTVIAVTIR